nr:immunoglobulin light chain junction region [Macaca mulatta]MOV61046.1 immunoglobulin light chain junction region [Macaca mulatta]MOV61410.1 immunoglobulin light chain junction region [Macaca mulatta]MOV61462.1 immunoglobulin light chain junction region [Macaca mulatta]MOV61491.1 immunoglobulin light chain junction region [Macaca mulatta]
CQQHNNYPYSF